jgi:hypothetical protein
MTDISVVTTAYQSAKRSWLLSPHGAEDPGTNPSITLDISKFTAGTHYVNGFIPSGTVVTKVTATGLWGPYDSTASDGRQTPADDAVGILFGDSTVIRPNGSAATKVGAAIVVHGFVNTNKLPFGTGVAGGLGAAAKTALRLIWFRAL